VRVSRTTQVPSEWRRWSASYCAIEASSRRWETRRCAARWPSDATGLHALLSGGATQRSAAGRWAKRAASGCAGTSARRCTGSPLDWLALNGKRQARRYSGRPQRGFPTLGYRAALTLIARNRFDSVLFSSRPSAAHVRRWGRFPRWPENPSARACRSASRPTE